jgi:hypothetical protein
MNDAAEAVTLKDGIIIEGASDVLIAAVQAGTDKSCVNPDALRCLRGRVHGVSRRVGKCVQARVELIEPPIRPLPAETTKARTLRSGPLCVVVSRTGFEPVTR